VHSNVCKLDILNRSKEVREGSSNAKPLSGKDLIASLCRSPIERKEIISNEFRDVFLDNFLQFHIRSDLKLCGIPPSGNVSISGKS
jgi:hypothetical protein